MKNIILVVAIVVISGNIFGQRVIDAKFGKGILNVIALDSSWSMKFGARFQTLYVGGVDLNDSIGPMGAESNRP